MSAFIYSPVLLRRVEYMTCNKVLYVLDFVSLHWFCYQMIIWKSVRTQNFNLKQSFTNSCKHQKQIPVNPKSYFSFLMTGWWEDIRTEFPYVWKALKSLQHTVKQPVARQRTRGDGCARTRLPVSFDSTPQRCYTLHTFTRLYFFSPAANLIWHLL